VAEFPRIRHDNKQCAWLDAHSAAKATNCNQLSRRWVMWTTGRTSATACTGADVGCMRRSSRAVACASWRLDSAGSSFRTCGSTQHSVTSCVGLDYTGLFESGQMSRNTRPRLLQIGRVHLSYIREFSHKQRAVHAALCAQLPWRWVTSYPPQKRWLGSLRSGCC
jgi:hypothetical protein